MAALHLTLSGFGEVNVDQKPCLQDSPSPKRRSVPREVLITDRDFPSPHISIPSVFGSSRKHAPHKHRRRCFGRRKSRNKRTQRKTGRVGKRTMVKLSCSREESASGNRRSPAPHSHTFLECIYKLSAGKSGKKLNHHHASRVYGRGRGWHRSHCRKRDILCQPGFSFVTCP